MFLVAELKGSKETRRETEKRDEGKAADMRRAEPEMIAIKIREVIEVAEDEQ